MTAADKTYKLITEVDLAKPLTPAQSRRLRKLLESFKPVGFDGELDVAAVHITCEAQ